MSPRRSEPAALSNAARTLTRNLRPWLIAVASTSVVGSLVQSHLNLVNVLQMGAYATWSDWQRTVLHDLGTFMPFFAVLVGAAFLVAFPVALRLARRWPAGSASLFALAGGAGLAAAFLIADVVAPIPTLISGTRNVIGYSAMVATGMLGGLIFQHLLGHPELRSGKSFTIAHFVFPVAVLVAAFAVHLVMRPERADEFEDVPSDRYRIASLVGGLEHPWAMAPLPDGRILVTERPGALRIVDTSGALVREPIEGLPEILQGTQGGLMDLELSPEFEQDRMLYITYACGTASENNTCVGRGRLTDHRLEDFECLFRAEPLKNTTVQFGSRLIFLPDGTMLVSIGDGFDFREDAQDLGNHIGSIVRLNPDGSVPPDNPFVDDEEARPEIYSYGHRNPQGLHYDEVSGRLYESEHGPYGGDEVNRIEPGENYGWPLTTEGINYPGTNISPHDALDEARAPLTHWTPSIAPSGITVYRGDAFPDFDGDLLVSALAGKAVFRLELENGEVVGRQRLFHELGKRIRDVVVGADGELYLLTDHAPGELLRVDPSDSPR